MIRQHFTSISVRFADDDFIENTPFLQKMWFMMVSTTIVRFKYYHAWLMADAICNNSGLGFDGYQKDGSPKWDLISNVNVIGFEVSRLQIIFGFVLKFAEQRNFSWSIQIDSNLKIDQIVAPWFLLFIFSQLKQMSFFLHSALYSWPQIYAMR